MRLLSVLWLAVLIVGLKTSAAPAQVSVPEEILSAEDLVEQLGDESYARRERAREELQRRESEVQLALEEGLKSDDLEVRYHCERLLIEIRERTIERRLATFVDNVGQKEEFDFPAWDLTRAAIGDTRDSRALYVAMYNAESELLQLLAEKPEDAGLQVDIRAKLLLIRRTPGLFQNQVTIGNIAALLLAAGEEEVTISATGKSQIYSLCHQPQFREAMQADGKELFRKLLSRYLAQCDGVHAYQGMTLARQYEMTEEALACAHKLLNGKAGVPSYKGYAMLMMARMGDAKQLEYFKPFLDDKTQVTQSSVNKVIYKTELRDVALFATIVLSKEDPKKFGFGRFTPNATTVANINTLGFSTEELRAEAVASWEEFQEEQSAKNAESPASTR